MLHKIFLAVEYRNGTNIIRLTNTLAGKGYPVTVLIGITLVTVFISYQNKLERT
jgi:hypothetical protein